MPSMRALAMARFGGPEVLELMDLPRPVPGADEVLIRVATVAANRQDLYTLAGRANNQSSALPHIPGNDPAGLIVEVGAAVDPARLGERVVVKPAIACEQCPACLAGDSAACQRLTSVGLHRPGGFAEFVAVPARNAVRVPDGIGYPEATALAQSAPVALTMLHDRARLVGEDVVVVSGGAGAIGSAVIQIAKRAGAFVIALVSDAERASIARARGADHVIDYAEVPAFGDALRSLAPGGGVTLYVETAGAPVVWEQVYRAMARRGRIVVCGSHAGPTVPIDLNWLFRNRLSILGASGSTLAAFTEALSLAAEGAITPHIDSIRPWTQAPEAFGRLLTHENRGKVVLRVTDDPAPDPSR